MGQLHKSLADIDVPVLGILVYQGLDLPLRGVEIARGDEIPGQVVAGDALIGVQVDGLAPHLRGLGHVPRDGVGEGEVGES